MTSDTKKQTEKQSTPEEGQLSESGLCGCLVIDDCGSYDDACGYFETDGSVCYDSPCGCINFR